MRDLADGVGRITQIPPLGPFILVQRAQEPLEINPGSAHTRSYETVLGGLADAFSNNSAIEAKHEVRGVGLRDQRLDPALMLGQAGAEVEQGRAGMTRPLWARKTIPETDRQDAKLSQPHDSGPSGILSGAGQGDR